MNRHESIGEANGDSSSSSEAASAFGTATEASASSRRSRTKFRRTPRIFLHARSVSSASGSQATSAFVSATNATASSYRSWTRRRRRHGIRLSSGHSAFSSGFAGLRNISIASTSSAAAKRSSPRNRAHLDPTAALTARSLPCILTPNLLAITDQAASAYESIQWSRSPSEIHFSRVSPEELESYYNVVIDARNALALRQSVILADIGDCLELLSEKLRLYDKDDALIQSAFYDVQCIKQETASRGLNVNFWALEYIRSGSSSAHCGASFIEDHSNIYSALGYVLDTKQSSQRVAKQFINDPQALREHRLAPHPLSWR